MGLFYFYFSVSVCVHLFVTYYKVSSPVILFVSTANLCYSAKDKLDSNIALEDGKLCL